jgi:hypothetical protein
VTSDRCIDVPVVEFSKEPIDRLAARPDSGAKAPNHFEVLGMGHAKFQAGVRLSRS